MERDEGGMSCLFKAELTTPQPFFSDAKTAKGELPVSVAQEHSLLFKSVPHRGHSPLHS